MEKVSRLQLTTNDFVVDGGDGESGLYGIENLDERMD